MGSDGKLYKMLDHKEWGKFKTTTEQDDLEELRKSKEIKENIYLLNGKMTNGRYTPSRSSGGVRLVAPQFGTQSRTRKHERREWERGVDCLATQGAVDGQSRYYETFTALVGNQTCSASERACLPASIEPPRSFSPADGGLRVSQNSEDRIAAAVRAIKDKYEQNLHVVEQLFDEKRLMERKVQLLEERLRRRAAHSDGVGREDEDSPGDLQEMSVEDQDIGAGWSGDVLSLPPVYDEVVSAERDALRGPPLSSYDPSDHHTGGCAHEDRRGGRYSAVELAGVLDGGASTRAPQRPLSAPARRPPAPTRSAYSPQRGRTTGVSQSARASRSVSAGSRRSTSSSMGISANLQADADR